MLHWFYRFCLWQLNFEIAIAEATGRNPANTSALKQARAWFAGMLHMQEINRAS